MSIDVAIYIILQVNLCLRIDISYDMLLSGPTAYYLNPFAGIGPSLWTLRIN